MVPVGFTWSVEDAEDAAGAEDAGGTGVGLARVTMRRGSRKARNVSTADGAARAVLCSVEGRRWITLEGAATITEDPHEVAEALRSFRPVSTSRPAPQAFLDVYRGLAEGGADRPVRLAGEGAPVLQHQHRADDAAGAHAAPPPASRCTAAASASASSRRRQCSAVSSGTSPSLQVTTTSPPLPATNLPT